MLGSSIRNVLGSILVIALISACNQSEPLPQNVVVSRVPVAKPAPIVPEVNVLKLRDVEWHVITADNYQEVFDKIRSSGLEPVLFGLTAEGYENLSLNLNDVRALIQQYQEIVVIYERSYK